MTQIEIIKRKIELKKQLVSLVTAEIQMLEKELQDVRDGRKASDH